MNLLVKIQEAYRATSTGHNPNSVDRMKEALGPEAMAAWKRANLPDEALTRSPEDTQKYARRCGINLEEI